MGQLAIKSLPINSLDSYLAQVNQIPVLSAQQEHALAVSYQESGDLQAAQQLVISHLRYVVRIARGYQGYGLQLADLIQEGTLGLMKAVKRFDPGQGVRLASFAVHWIKSEIHDFVIRHWRIVKVATTKAQRKCFFNLRSQKKRLGWFTQEEVEAVAADLGVKPEEVLEMEQRLQAQDAAYDGFDSIDDDAQHAMPVLPAPTPNPMDEVCAQRDFSREALMQAIAKLDERSQQILQARWLAEPAVPLKALAEKFGISIERVRQVEKAAIGRLTEILKRD